MAHNKFAACPNCNWRFVMRNEPPHRKGKKASRVVCPKCRHGFKRDQDVELKEPNVPFRIGPGKYVDVKQAVEKERKEKKIVRSLGRLPSVMIDEEPETPKERAGYTCISCGRNPALKDNGSLCEICAKRQENPVYRTTSLGLHTHG